MLNGIDLPALNNLQKAIVSAASISVALCSHAAPLFAGIPSTTPISGAPSLPVGTYEVGKFDYVMTEATVSGDARSFVPVGETGDNGRWTVQPFATGHYKTRIIIIKPLDKSKFNGTVVVEWMNVTGGMDVPVEWVNTHRELVRSGYAYVGVTAQKVGIDGDPDGPNAQAPYLKKMNPSRYGSLVHPGDAYSYDIFSDVGRLLRAPGSSGLLGSLKLHHILAVGESQSAAFLATYVNAVDPLARVYDGFLIHSRPGMVARLDGKGVAAMDAAWRNRAVKLRPDLRVPVIQLITETDLVQLLNMRGFQPARQADQSKLRTWEIAGTAHADNYLFYAGQVDTPDVPIEQLAAAWAPLRLGGGSPINNGPQQHYMAQAALRHLNRWVVGGKAPPHGPLLDARAGLPPTLLRGSFNIVLGGVRSPWVDVPTSTLIGSDKATIATLTGSVRPFDQATLAKLYPGGEGDYMTKFSMSLDRTIRGGFILADDRKEIEQLAALSFEHSAK